ncbi:hypothetical protein HJFPF1_11426 [Paramyrothecium foliicola]|nr:hypothetical protein HJFPF1_11426 [Paramyrothecium foliicola]
MPMLSLSCIVFGDETNTKFFRACQDNKLFSWLGFRGITELNGQWDPDDVYHYNTPSLRICTLSTQYRDLAWAVEGLGHGGDKPPHPKCLHCPGLANLKRGKMAFRFLNWVLSGPNFLDVSKTFNQSLQGFGDNIMGFTSCRISTTKRPNGEPWSGMRKIGSTSQSLLHITGLFSL